MPDEQIDALLDDSAPRVARGAIPAPLLREMVQEARAVAAPGNPARARRRNISITAALAGVLVVGGGGMAVAGGLVSWPSGYEAPDNAFSFTLPSGRACETRLVMGSRMEGREQRAIPDDSQLSPPAQRAQQLVTDWLHQTDLLATVNLAASEHEVDSILQKQRAADMTVLIGEDGWLTDARISTSREADADDRYAFAVTRALRAAMRERFAASDMPEAVGAVGPVGGVKCAAE